MEWSTARPSLMMNVAPHGAASLLDVFFNICFHYLFDLSVFKFQVRDHKLDYKY